MDENKCILKYVSCSPNLTIEPPNHEKGKLTISTCRSRNFRIGYWRASYVIYQKVHDWLLTKNCYLHQCRVNKITFSLIKVQKLMLAAFVSRIPIRIIEECRIFKNNSNMLKPGQNKKGQKTMQVEMFLALLIL